MASGGYASQVPVLYPVGNFIVDISTQEGILAFLLCLSSSLIISFILPFQVFGPSDAVDFVQKLLKVTGQNLSSFIIVS